MAVRGNTGDEIAKQRTCRPAIERGEKNLQLVTLERIGKGLKYVFWQVMKDTEKA